MSGGIKGPLVIVGDALLDVDVAGHAGRLCPDAPVPVLDDLVEHPRPGGAALAAAMAHSEGTEVVLVTAIGLDEAGSALRSLLGGIELAELGSPGQTPVKRRVMAGGQTLVRLDTGGEAASGLTASQSVVDVIRSAAAVLVADYGRGAVEAPGIRDVLREVALDVPLVWDPHPRGGAPVAGARLVTPNEDEAAHLAARRGLAVEGSRGSLHTVRLEADALARAWRAHAVAVTLGSRGALVSFGGGTPVLAPAPVVTSIDTCGAGDRFAVAAATALGEGAVISEAVTDAVCRAAEYVSAGGPRAFLARSVPAAESAGEVGRDEGIASAHRGGTGAVPGGAVSPDARHAGTLVATGGCFDLLHAGHVETLRAARALGDRLVVCLNSDESVRRLKGQGRPLVPAADRARVLLALECVDEVVVFDEDTPVEVLRRLRPDIWTKGGDYSGAHVPEAAVLDEWGGQAVVLPYVRGRSTTALVRAASGMRQTETPTRSTSERSA